MKRVKLLLIAITVIIGSCIRQTVVQNDANLSINSPVPDTNNSANTDSLTDNPIASDWKGKKCESYSEDDGYSSIEECTFPKANLRQVYNIVKKMDPNLKAELPLTDIEYQSNEEGGFPNVEYKYKSKKHLLIELFYAGGVTYIEIIENKGYTQSKITYSSD